MISCCKQTFTIQFLLFSKGMVEWRTEQTSFNRWKVCLFRMIEHGSLLRFRCLVKNGAIFLLLFPNDWCIICYSECTSKEYSIVIVLSVAWQRSHGWFTSAFIESRWSGGKKKWRTWQSNRVLKTILLHSAMNTYWQHAEGEVKLCQVLYIDFLILYKNHGKFFFSYCTEYIENQKFQDYDAFQWNDGRSKVFTILLFWLFHIN